MPPQINEVGPLMPKPSVFTFLILHVLYRMISWVRFEFLACAPNYEIYGYYSLEPGLFFLCLFITFFE